jgi:hypothetical protein
MGKFENFEIESKKIEFGLKCEMTFNDLSDEEKLEIFGNKNIQETDLITVENILEMCR